MATKSKQKKSKKKSKGAGTGKTGRREKTFASPPSKKKKK